LICIGQIKSSDKHPTLQKTQLGWILAIVSFGQHYIDRLKDSLVLCVTNAELYERQSCLANERHICAIEQLHNGRKYSLLDNVSQNSQSRYTVKLSVREQMLNDIGDSREAALKRLRGI